MAVKWIRASYWEEAKINKTKALGRQTKLFERLTKELMQKLDGVFLTIDVF
jgi:hypothetical protein